MNIDEAKALVKKHGSLAAAAREAGVPSQTFKDRVRRGVWPEDRAPAPGKAGGRPLADFRATYDKAYIVPRKVRDGLRALAGGWEYEVGFAKLAGVSLSDLSAFRDQFAEHVVQLREGRRAWAGSAATAKQMRAML